MTTLTRAIPAHALDLHPDLPLSAFRWRSETELVIERPDCVVVMDYPRTQAEAEERIEALAEAFAPVLEVSR